MENTSGIRPKGDKILILPDEIEEVTEGGLVIPKHVTDRHAMAQSIGVFIEAGPDAWIDHVEKDKDGCITKVVGFSGPMAKPGDRVAFAKYGGLPVEGVDGKQYRIMSDTDVTAEVDEGVNFTDLKSRKEFMR